MKIHHFILPTLLLIQACSHVNPGRWIASAPLSPPELSDLSSAIAQIKGDVLDESFTESCLEYMQDLQKKVESLDTRKFSRVELKEASLGIADNIFSIRKTLHENMDEYSSECVVQLQANYRQFRFLEDYLMELGKDVVHLTPSDIKFQDEPVPRPGTEVNYYDFKLTSENSEFKAGDLFISRGVSFLSAMIARLGQRATQFSHVVMISNDPKTGEQKTIESYVGVGVSFYDMDYALKNENARILWLRAKDEKLAKKASDKMSALVSKRLEDKNPIKYDYELNFNDPTTMSCAEVSQVAFEMASDGKFNIPYHPNIITGARSMIERLHLPEGDTYEPGDMEIDPRFELVGEFRDLRLTRDSRQKDAIMTALFDWMTHKNYELKDNLKSKMAGGVIYDVRRTFMWPLVKKLLKLDDFSKEIPRNMLKTVTLINQLGEGMLVELKAQDLAHEKKYGLPMSYVDFYRTLEEMRVKDLEAYKNKKTRKKSVIHKFIRER